MVNAGAEKEKPAPGANLSMQHEGQRQNHKKEEFVTSGGISLEELRLPDMELKKWPGLYAVGELTDVDGITGGYNFQYAWSSGFMAGRHAAK